MEGDPNVLDCGLTEHPKRSAITGGRAFTGYFLFQLLLDDTPSAVVYVGQRLVGPTDSQDVLLNTRFFPHPVSAKFHIVCVLTCNWFHMLHLSSER